MMIREGCQKIHVKSLVFCQTESNPEPNSIFEEESLFSVGPF